MQRIRDNIFLVTYSELGKPPETGYYKVEGLGEVLIDDADWRYICEYLDKGYEPAFFVSQSAALKNAFVVVSRQRC